MRIRSDAVRRFTAIQIASHWLHVVPFFVLILTGLPLYVPELNGIAGVFGGFPVTRLIHRVAALLFISSFIIHPIFAWADFRRLLSELVVKPLDFRGFIAHFAIGKAVDPATGKFNVGQKLLWWMTVDGAVIMIVTGLIMWFPDPFPRALVQFMYPAHDVGMILMITPVFGHMYLAVVAYQGSMSAMTHGYVSRQFARHFHPAWYEEEMEEKQPGQLAGLIKSGDGPGPGAVVH